MGATNPVMSESQTVDESKPTLLLYYDGECPICNAYRDYVDIRRGHDLQLLNARDYPDEMHSFHARGIDINSGMILVDTSNDRIFHGAKAIVALNSYTGRRGWMDGLTRSLLRLPGFVEFAYPFARGLRHVLLRMVGRSTRIELDREDPGA